MEYRKNIRSGKDISVIGLGSSSIGGSSAKEIQETVEHALEKGVNYFDMAAGDSKPFAPYGDALAATGKRSSALFQIHFGANYESGSYGWTTNPEKIRKSVEWQMKMLRTDYIDFGFIHCLDEDEDLEAVRGKGIIDHILKLKEQGIVRNVGLSTHTPAIAEKLLDMGMIDMLMFSINPGYDWRHGDYAKGSTDERMRLYRRCEAEGVGISVMKPFSGGQLLDAGTSPFHRALSRYQCIQYALDKPGVLTVLPGVRNMADLDDVLGFLDAPASERDYSVIGSFTPSEAEGICVYCNHCQPCPRHIDVGLVNKYYDLAKAGDRLAVSHYQSLAVKADACISCGHCDRRCPFHVSQSSRMKEIAEYFLT
ncbi:MAG: aldo/keto reductase [Bacteroidetes bacterium]|uniref:Aldo/keto reductase n=1 Tax=Candidatus Cryptobacteroides merdavium TaxID=2840769 RepID=A0A9D9HCG6_9BACT|nr:aldo/keto reductase [Candidatus Cryptobacteroides merdavium]